jgi:hypothetical protein
MLFVDFPDQQPTWFIRSTSRNLHQPGVGPKILGFLDIDAVLALVLCNSPTGGTRKPPGSPNNFNLRHAVYNG